MAGGFLQALGSAASDVGDTLGQLAEQKKRDVKRAMDDYDRTGRWDEKVLGPHPIGVKQGGATTESTLKVPMLDAFGGQPAAPGGSYAVKPDYFKEVGGEQTKPGKGMFQDIRSTDEYQRGQQKRKDNAELFTANYNMADSSLTPEQQNDIKASASKAGDVKSLMGQAFGRNEEHARDARELKQQEERLQQATDKEASGVSSNTKWVQAARDLGFPGHDGAEVAKNVYSSHAQTAVLQKMTEDPTDKAYKREATQQLRDARTDAAEIKKRAMMQNEIENIVSEVYQPDMQEPIIDKQGRTMRDAKGEVMTATGMSQGRQMANAYTRWSKAHYGAQLSDQQLAWSMISAKVKNRRQAADAEMDRSGGLPKLPVGSSAVGDGSGGRSGGGNGKFDPAAGWNN